MRVHWNVRSRGLGKFLLTWVSLFSAGSALAQEPCSVTLRVVSWNIEMRGFPQRSEAETHLIAERIRSWKPAVLVLQEMVDIGWRQRLTSELGSSWRGYYADLPDAGQEALLWDSGKVELLEADFLTSLTRPPYTSYPTLGYQGLGHYRPVTGVFRPIGWKQINAKPFRVIGLHCHPEGGYASEGAWLRSRVLEWLEEPDEWATQPSTTHDIILGGDLNAAPGDSLHVLLQEGDHLHLVPKENGESTTIGVWCIDHFYVTQSMRNRLYDEASFVVRPEQYGETPEQFESIYSDHLPIILDIGVQAATVGWEIYN